MSVNSLSSLGRIAPTASVGSARPVRETRAAESALTDRVEVGPLAPPAPAATASAPVEARPPESRPEPEPVKLPPVPVTLSEEDGREELEAILQAAGDTAMKDHPHLEDIRRRFPQLPDEVRAHGMIPLLDALTTPGVEQAGAKLDAFHDTMTWARKHRSEARSLVADGGDWQRLERAASEARAAQEQPKTSLDRALSGPGLLKSYPLGDNHKAEGARLIDQLEAGNTNPGLGTKTLGKGICYLRGREGTRIFYRMQDDRPEYLVVCNKASEDSAINLLRREFDLR